MTDDAVKAAAEAVWHADFEGYWDAVLTSEECDVFARVAVEAARPHIEGDSEGIFMTLHGAQRRARAARAEADQYRQQYDLCQGERNAARAEAARYRAAWETAARSLVRYRAALEGLHDAIIRAPDAWFDAEDDVAFTAPGPQQADPLYLVAPESAIDVARAALDGQEQAWPLDDLEYVLPFMHEKGRDYARTLVNRLRQERA